MIIANLRHYSENHKGAAIAIAIVPLVIAGALMYGHYSSPAEPEWPKAYFFDEASGEVSVRPADEFPPLLSSSGTPTIVRAIYVTHGGPDQKTLAYLEKYTDEAKAALRRTTATEPGTALARPQLLSGLLVRKPDAGSPWLVAGSPEAEKLMEEVYKPGPDGTPPRMCPP